MLAMSLSTLIANYHTALRHYWVMFYVGIGAAVTAVCIALNHATPGDVVQGLAIGSLAMLAGLVGWTGLRAGFRLR